MAKRKSRDEIDNSKINLLKPLDINKFTEAEDPCFGKLHSLAESACNICGDAEICSIVTTQVLKVKREQLESQGDIKMYHDKPDYKSVRKFIRAKLKKGVSEANIIKLTRGKWEISKKKTKSIITKIQNKNG